MILVDSSVWIDQFAGRDTQETRCLERLLEIDQPIGIGDLVLAEVLQGTRDERDFRDALTRFGRFQRVQISDFVIAKEAAHRYQILRGRGVTIRKTIDTLLATRCILDDIPLLYRDRDFDPFVMHLGLRSALNFPGAS